MPTPKLPEAPLGTEELQRLFPGERQEDIRRYLALVRSKGISAENARWLVSFSGCIERATARLAVAELPSRTRLN